MVSGDDHKRLIEQAAFHERVEKTAEQSVEVLHLQDVSLFLHARLPRGLGRHPIALIGRFVARPVWPEDPRLMWKQQMKKVKARTVCRLHVLQPCIEATFLEERHHVQDVCLWNRGDGADFCSRSGLILLFDVEDREFVLGGAVETLLHHVPQLADHSAPVRRGVACRRAKRTLTLGTQSRDKFRHVHVVCARDQREQGLWMIRIDTCFALHRLSAGEK